MLSEKEIREMLKQAIESKVKANDSKDNDIGGHFFHGEQCALERVLEE